MSFTVKKQTLYNMIIESITGPSKSAVEKTKQKTKKIQSKAKSARKKDVLKQPPADPTDLTGELGDGSGLGKGVYEKENTQSDRSPANEPERQKKWPFEKRTKGRRFGLKEADKKYPLPGMSAEDKAQLERDAKGIDNDLEPEDFEDYPEYKMAQNIESFMLGANKAYADYLTDFTNAEGAGITSAQMTKLAHETLEKHSHFASSKDKDYDLGYKAGLHMAYEEMMAETHMVAVGERPIGSRPRATESEPDADFIVDFVHDLVIRLHDRYAEMHSKFARLKQISSANSERSRADIEADERQMASLMAKEEALVNLHGEDVFVLGDMVSFNMVPDEKHGDVVARAIASLSNTSPKLQQIIQKGFELQRRASGNTLKRRDFLHTIVSSYLKKYHAPEPDPDFGKSQEDVEAATALYYVTRLTSFVIKNMEYNVVDPDTDAQTTAKARYIGRPQFLSRLSEESFAELKKTILDRIKKETKRGKITVLKGIQYPYRPGATADDKDKIVVSKEAILKAVDEHLKIFEEMLASQRDAAELDPTDDDAPLEKKKRKGGRTAVEIPDGTWMEYLKNTGRTEKDVLHLSNADETRFVKMLSREQGVSESAIRNILYNHMLAFGMDPESISDIKTAAQISYETGKIPTVFDPLKLQAQALIGRGLFDLYREMFENFLRQGSGRYLKADKKKGIKKDPKTKKFPRITNPEDLPESESSEVINMFLYPKAKNLLRHEKLTADDISDRPSYNEASDKTEFLKGAQAGFEVYRSAIEASSGKSTKKEVARGILVNLLKKEDDLPPGSTKDFKKGYVAGLNYGYTVGFFSIIPTTYRELERESAYERSYAVFNFFARNMSEFVADLLLNDPTKIPDKLLDRMGITPDNLKDAETFYHNRQLPFPAQDLGTSKGKPVSEKEHIDFYLRYAHEGGGVKHLITVFRGMGFFRADNRSEAEDRLEKFTSGMMRLLKTTYQQETMDVLMKAIASTESLMKKRRKAGL